MATVLRVGHLIDGTGAAPLRDAEIRFEGTRITGVGPQNSQARAGDTVHDHPGWTATPGFTDLHTHFCYPVDGEFQTAAMVPNRVHLLVLGFRAAERWLAQGVTTARDVGTPFDLDIELKELLAEGVATGPRLVAAGRMLTMVGGRRTPYDFMKEEISGATAAREWTRRHLKDGADVIKLYCTTLLEADVGAYLQRALELPEGQPDPGRWASLSVDEIRAVVHEAHKAGRTVAAHVAPAFGIKLALKAGVDTIEHGSELDDECTELFLESGATLVPTLSITRHQIEHGDELGLPPVFTEFSRRRWDRIAEGVAKAHRAGVKIATGTDPVLPGMSYATELEALVACGLSPL
jgi:imidazolonepropionase-like amidohydrolase